MTPRLRSASAGDTTATEIDAHSALESLPNGFVEPLIYLAAGTIVAGVALLAGLPAALRAASVAPMGAIRSE